MLRDRLGRVRAELKGEKEQRLTLQHTLKEWEASIAQLHERHAEMSGKQEEVVAAHRVAVVECELLKEEVVGLRGEVGRLEGRVKEVEEERRGLQVRVQRMEGEAEVVQAMAGLNVEEMRGVMGGWERMAEVWKGVVGKLDKREGDREREGVGEVNAGGLNSARSAVSDGYARGRGRGKEAEEEKVEVEVRAGGGMASARSRSSSSSSSSSSGSVESEGSEESGSEGEGSEWESRPSTGESGMGPASARSSASSSSHTTTSSAASEARWRDKERRERGREQGRSGVRERGGGKQQRSATTSGRAQPRPPPADRPAVVGKRR